MASKEVVVRQKAAGAVAAALDRFAAGLASALADDLAPEAASPGQRADPDPAASLEVVLGALESLLLRRRDELVAAEEAHLVRQAAARALRQRRARLVRQLRRQVLDVRKLLTVAFGPGTAARVGLSGRTARDLHGLVRQATLLATRLGELEPPPIEGSVDGLQVEVAALAEPLGTAARELEKVLQQVVVDRRDLETTLAAKTAARTAFDTTYLSVVDVLEGVCRLAGQPERARRIRVRLRRGTTTGFAQTKAEEADESEAVGGRERATGRESGPGAARPQVHSPLP